MFWGKVPLGKHQQIGQTQLAFELIATRMETIRNPLETNGG